MNIDDSLHQSTRTFSTLEKKPLPFSRTNHDYWMNSNHVEILATKIQNISPQNQYTILETEDDSGETIAHGTSPGYGGNTSGGGTGSYPGGNNTGGQGQDPNRGNDGGEESAPIEVRGIRARPDADGQLAIVDDQNNFVREAHYNGPAGSRNYDITVDSTVLDAQKTYSDIEDQQATDQQITDFLKDVAAGQTYSDIRSTVINSPDMKSVMNSYEQQLYGVAPDQNTQDWLKTNLQNGRTIQDVRWEDAHSQRMTDAIFSMINGVQDRNDASDAYDANYKNITMDALGRKEISFFQNRNNLIDSSGENGVIDDYEQQLYGTNAGQNDQNWVRNNLHNGRTMQDIRWEDSHSQRMTDSIVGLYSSLANYTPYNDQISSWQNTFANGQGNYNSAHSIIAHGSEATAALTTAMQMVTGQQPSNSAALQPYQDAMANGGSLNDAIYKFAHSDQAKIASNIFIAANIGPATVSLINASEAMLTNIAQAYQSMKNYSESQIQSTANGYHAAFRAGDALNSVMPNTWEGWLGLTATIVIFMTPPGEAVAIAEVAAIGGEELLSLALDTETNIALDSLYATGTSDLVTTVSQSEIDILAQFTPRQSGATLDLGNGVIVTQTEGNLKKAGALIFKGGNFDAVSSYFKTLTGYSGDLEAIKNNTSTIPEGAAIYKIKTNLGYVSMRNITSSIGDFTIEFTNRLNNGIKEIKFLF